MNCRAVDVGCRAVVSGAVTPLVTPRVSGCRAIVGSGRDVGSALSTISECKHGLRKLVEHIWALIGIARTCTTMIELRDRMAALNGKSMVQLFLLLPNVPRTPGIAG